MDSFLIFLFTYCFRCLFIYIYIVYIYLFAFLNKSGKKLSSGLEDPVGERGGGSEEASTKDREREREEQTDRQTERGIDAGPKGLQDYKFFTFLLLYIQ